jgi:hypothetical protein
MHEAGIGASFRGHNGVAHWTLRLGRFASDPLIRQRASVLFLGFSVLLFLAPQLGKVLSIGLCCADDGYFAMIAKRFSETGAYGLSPQWVDTETSNDTFSLFNGQIGTGPALILPVALATKLFGARLWVPGGTALLIFCVQISAATRLIGRVTERWRAYHWVAVALLSLIAVTPYQDYVAYMFGEPTSFGYVLVGGALLSFYSDQDRALRAAGLCFGLALLTKYLALFSAAGVGLAFLISEFRHHGWRRTGEKLLQIATCAAAPLILFEAVKFLTLGPSGYANHWSQLADILQAYHHHQSANRLLEFSNVIGNQYTIGWTQAAALTFSAAIVGLFVWRFGPHGTRLFCVALFAGGLFHLAYFLAISQMWPRYCWPGIALMVFALASPLLLLEFRNAVAWVLVCAVTVATPSAIAHSVTFSTRYGMGGGVTTRRGAADYAEIARERDSLLRLFMDHPGVLLAGQSWLSTFDTLYLLQEDRPWLITNDENRLPFLNAIVFFYERFADTRYPSMQGVLKSCRLMTPAAKFYKAYACGHI